jgi:hypothetical protein
MKVIIERDKLVNLIERGVKQYYVAKNRDGNAKMSDCILKEIDLYIAFGDKND